MSKGMRLTERWMNLCLWLVALAFAAFLIGLGGIVVNNLEFSEDPIAISDYIDPVRGPVVHAAQRAAEQAHVAANNALDQARLAHEKAAANSKAAEDTFNNWIKTRMATAGKEQDGQLLSRTRDLDVLKAAERSALAFVEAEQQTMLNASQALWKKCND